MATVRYKNYVDQFYRFHKQDLVDRWVNFHSWIGTPELSDRDFYECLRVVWVSIEHVGNPRSFWLGMFMSQRLGKEKWLMTKKEVAYLKNLPETVPVYRGCPLNKVNGMSWSTDKDKATWFGNRFNFGGGKPPFDKECCLVTGQVAKADICAVFLERNEFEVVCDPKNVKRKKKDILPPMK